MLLKTLFIRFYKSFNFDYLRKHDKKARTQRWEIMGDELWYPYVAIPIDPQITTVVGANESGKSHLLRAIEKGVSGKDIKRDDFCRYSEFFKIQRGKMLWPDFGFEWNQLTSDERKIIQSACGVNEGVDFDHFLLFRNEVEKLAIFLPSEGDYTRYDLKPEGVTKILAVLPHVFRLKENVGLPKSVPIKWLAAKESGQNDNKFERLERSARFQLFETLLGHPQWFATNTTVSQNAGPISAALAPFTNVNANTTNDKAAVAELELARDLMSKIAGIDSESLSELYNAIREGNDGFVNALVQKINNDLAAALNFPSWWVQDRQFRLIVSVREFDLVFTIRDKTGTDYTFSERSSGLRYFLSYYIQYLAHEESKGVPEILLMDEPDAFLSSQGQQDLLKIFHSFANPPDGRRPIQVVFVTHSPFLIDKNHGDRIRVLEKGVGDEGTRVVRDVSRNHYEPLRSAFGAFVGETVFIGHCNLMVEGLSDQILIAGMTTHLLGKGESKLQTLDLNHITIVPAGSASHIAYLVFLARGRDVEQPAVIVLLDSDEAGKNAKKDILRGGPKRKELLSAKFILQIEELANESGLKSPEGLAVKEIEDLIPVALAVKAAQNYLRDVCDASDKATLITEETMKIELKRGKGIFDAVESCFSSAGVDGLHIEKVGFARTVTEIVVAHAENGSAINNGVHDFEANMKVLFTRLSQMQRVAERELLGERVSNRVERARESFLRDHRSGAKREEGALLLEDLSAALDDSVQSDQAKLEINGLRRDFCLETDVTKPIDDYKNFRERLERVKYAGQLAAQEPVR
jgi:energy-coupling factor transporter ATP-binding protein EcfA2